MFAQSPKWSITSACDNIYEPRVVGSDSLNYYTVTRTKKQYTVDRFNKQTLACTSFKINFPEALGNIAEVSGAFQGANHKVVLILSGYKDKKRNYYAAVLNPADPGTPGNLIFLFDIPAWDKYYTGSFKLRASPGHRRFVLWNTFDTRHKFDKNTNLCVLSDDAEMLGRVSDLHLDEVNKELVTKYEVSDDGTIARLRQNKKDEHYIMLLNLSRGNVWQEAAITRADAGVPAGSAWMGGLTIGFRRDNRPVVAGFYASVDNGQKKLDGCFLFSYDMDYKKLEFMQNTLFDAETRDAINKNWSLDIYGKRSMYGFFKYAHMMPAPGNAMVFITENYFHYADVSTEGLTTGNRIMYGDILVMKFAENGSANLGSYIRKKQVHAQPTAVQAIATLDRINHFSYFTAFDKNRMDLYFVDDPKNEGDEDTRTNAMHNTRKAVMICHSFDLETMGTERKELPMGDDEKIQLAPRYSFQAGPGAPVILLGKDNKVYRIGVVE